MVILKAASWLQGTIRSVFDILCSLSQESNRKLLSLSHNKSWFSVRQHRYLQQCLCENTFRSVCRGKDRYIRQPLMKMGRNSSFTLFVQESARLDWAYTSVREKSWGAAGRGKTSPLQRRLPQLSTGKQQWRRFEHMRQHWQFQQQLWQLLKRSRSICTNILCSCLHSRMGKLLCLSLTSVFPNKQKLWQWRPCLGRK